MTIKEYIRKTAKEFRESGRIDAGLRVMLQYARAYENGDEALDNLRSYWIEREIGTKHSEGAQIAILFNKETSPTEYSDYQTFRASCKAKVDAKMATLKADLLNALSE